MRRRDAPAAGDGLRLRCRVDRISNKKLDAILDEYKEEAPEVAAQSGANSAFPRRAGTRVPLGARGARGGRCHLCLATPLTAPRRAAGPAFLVAVVMAVVPAYLYTTAIFEMDPASVRGCGDRPLPAALTPRAARAPPERPALRGRHCGGHLLAHAGVQQDHRVRV